MRILIATDAYWPSINGVAISVESFKTELEKLGHTVYIFAPCYNYRIESDTRKNINNVFRFKALKLFFSKFDRLVYKTEKKKAFKVADGLKPDIIHIQTEWSMGRFFAEYSKKRGIPCVTSCHTDWTEFASYVKFWPKKYVPWLMRKILKKVTENAEKIIVPTESMKEVLVKNNVENIEKCVVIPTGVNLDYFNNNSNDMLKLSFCERFPNLIKKKILLYVGRVGPEKNMNFLLDGFQILRRLIPDIKMLLVGDGIARKQIQQIINENRLENDIILPGFIGRDFIQEIYRKADVFVFSSKVESQGMVILEAMASGTPVVAIGRKGVKDTMNGNNGGYLIDDSLEEFVEKVIVLLNNKKLYRQKSEEAIEYASNFDMLSLSLRLEELYKEVVH